MRRLTTYILCAMGLLAAPARGEAQTVSSPQTPGFVDADGDGINDAYQGMHRARSRMRGKADWFTALAKAKLTDEQRARLQQASSDHQKAITSFQATLNVAQARLREAMQAAAPDRKVIEERIDALNTVRAQIQKAAAGYQLAVQGILTPEQWTELNRTVKAAKAADPGLSQRPAMGGGDVFVDEDGDGVCDGRGIGRRPIGPGVPKDHRRSRGNPEK
jgi:Spy/CpxP family protein refolding chaperone